VPIRDTATLRRLAALLSAGGEAAANARGRLNERLPRPKSRSGGELVAFFRASPLIGLELEIESAKSRGRDIDF
jgi:hypothetical protein